MEDSARSWLGGSRRRDSGLSTAQPRPKPQGAVELGHLAFTVQAARVADGRSAKPYLYG